MRAGSCVQNRDRRLRCCAARIGQGSVSTRAFAPRRRHNKGRTLVVVPALQLAHDDLHRSDRLFCAATAGAALCAGEHLLLPPHR